MRYFLSLFIFLTLPLKTLFGPPPPTPWFAEHITVLSVDLPEGIEVSVKRKLCEGQEYLVVENTSDVPLYIIGEHSDTATNIYQDQSFADIGMDFQSGTGPLLKIINGQAYRWNGVWEPIYDSRLELYISNNNIGQLYVDVLALDPVNQYTWFNGKERPDNIDIPEDQNVLLPMLYEEEMLYVPLNISYSLYPASVTFWESAYCNLRCFAPLFFIFAILLVAGKRLVKLFSSRITRHSSP